MSIQKDIANSRTQAKLLKEQGKYSEAASIYKKIYFPKIDKWIAWEYTVCLKKLMKIDEAIQVSKNTYNIDSDFHYNNNILSWLLYEKYFKNIKDDYDFKEIEKMYKIACFVADITSQDKNSAYEIIMLKMLKILKNNSNNPAQKILYILSKIDCNKLSSDAGKYQKNGREQEYQSQKEMYFSFKTKALFDLQQYDECVECCDEAITAIQQFHHDNKAWIRSRKAISLSNLENINEAIIEMQQVIIRKQHWSLFSQMASIYLNERDLDKALFYYCRAAITNDAPKMKVTLYYDIAKLLFEMECFEEAWKHVCLSKIERDRQDWAIPYDVQELFNKLRVKNFSTDFTFNDLKEFWLSTIYDLGGKEQGIVIKLNKNRKSGFIRSSNGSYFFKTNSIIDKNKNIREKDKVEFCLIKSYDAKKHKESQECGYIKVDRNDK